jgi:hypothetical protein
MLQIKKRQTLFERFFYLKYFQSEALRDVAKQNPFTPRL